MTLAQEAASHGDSGLCRKPPKSTYRVEEAKKAGEDQAIGRSRGGLSTKIHATADALGNPTGFLLTGGEAHDLAGADHLLPQVQADTVLGDKGFDADERVIQPLQAAGKTAVIPPGKGRKTPRDYDRDLYKARHLIETSSPSSSSSAPSPPATTRPPATSSPPSTWQQVSFGSIGDRP